MGEENYVQGLIRSGGGGYVRVHVSFAADLEVYSRGYTRDFTVLVLSCSELFSDSGPGFGCMPPIKSNKFIYVYCNRPCITPRI